MTNKEKVEVIHSKNVKIALAITGGGTEVIGELLRHGGGSKTIVSAYVPYSFEAVDEFLGQKPEKYCSQDTATHMAAAVWTRSNASLCFGACCSLTKENERQGREHHVYMAYCNHKECKPLFIEINLEGTREEQEKAVADLILDQIYQLVLNV